MAAAPEKNVFGDSKVVEVVEDVSMDTEKVPKDDVLMDTSSIVTRPTLPPISGEMLSVRVKG